MHTKSDVMTHVIWAPKFLVQIAVHEFAPLNLDVPDAFNLSVSYFPCQNVVDLMLFKQQYGKLV